MKRTITLVILLFLCALLLLNGCASQRELNSLMIVLGIGLDKDKDNPQNIQLTSQLVLPEVIKAQAQGSAQKPYWNVQSVGVNTFDAVREYTEKLSSVLYIAHTQVFVFGRSLAEDGINGPFDFFARAKETRPTTLMIISDTTAQDILETDTKINLMPAINLSKMVDAQKFTGESKNVTVSDYINAMLSKTVSFVAPLVGTQIQEDVKIPFIKGLAVFKQDKMAGEFSKAESRGLLWVRGWLKSGILSIDIPGGQAALEITNASSKVTPEINNGHVTMKVKIEASCVMGQQTAKENMATEENIKKMQKLAETAIMNEITITFAKAKSLNADVFGFGEEIHKTGAKEWKEMEKKWNEIFPQIELQVTVGVNIVATGTIEKPVGPIKEGE